MADTVYQIQGYFSGVRGVQPTGGGVVSGAPLNFYRAVGTTEGGAKIGATPLPATIYHVGPAYGAGYSINVEGIPFPILANWVWTSHIGSFDFTHTDDGEVVKFPVPWGGYIYSIKKLGTSGVVVYGENGDTFCAPHGVFWSSRKELLRIGIKGRSAVCTSENDRQHFFIDKTGLFWILTEAVEPKMIDYSVYFNQMSSSLAMSYDISTNVIYICDGTYGYVWSESGLGQGPVNITGVGYKSGVFYAAGNSPIVTDPFSIVTDIQDFGVRTEKTIYEIELGTTVVGDIYGCVDYRWNKAQAFTTSPWVKADRYGRIFLMITGVEFRIRIKLTVWEDIQLDYGNIRVRYDDLKPVLMEK
jgi:hypothetical protein